MNRIVLCTRLLAGASLLYAGAALAQTPRRTPAPTDPARLAWNAPQAPVRIFGNTWYVGPHGLASILIRSAGGDVLIDGDLPESAPVILANLRRLHVAPRQVKLILNSHAHYDHAGGIAAIQRASGARVMASPWSARVLEAGKSLPGDPQLDIAAPFAPVRHVRVLHDGETVQVGSLALTAHFTPGHTPGGTTWTWRSCDSGRCVDFVYADSQSPVSADDFFFTHNDSYPQALADFDRGLSVIAALPCDILLTPHPGSSEFWERVAARDSGDASALMDSGACKRFVESAREQIARRVQRESEPSHDTLTVNSRALGERRLVNVHLPAGYARAGAERFPVLYMPDGGMDEDFPHVVKSVDSLVALRLIRPVIVVGIPNTERRRDLTGPTRVKSDSAIAPRVGGSAKFRAFIASELIPLIDARYRTTAERSIVGESLAGLFIVETMLREPDLFQRYIAFDPSVWWNGGALVDSVRAFTFRMDATSRALFVAGSSDGIATGTSRLADSLRAAPPEGLLFIYSERPDLTHATVFHAAGPAALARLLR